MRSSSCRARSFARSKSLVLKGSCSSISSVGEVDERMEVRRDGEGSRPFIVMFLEAVVNTLVMYCLIAC